MSARYTKKIPEFIYMIDNGEWKQGPYVNKPKGPVDNLRTFKLVEVEDES